MTPPNAQADEALLPCPFCGGKAQGASGSSSIWIRCTNCGACGEEGMESEDAVIAAWNRRTPAPATASQWLPISSAPKDRMICLYAAPKYDLPGFLTAGMWHESGGWCVDELREATHWVPLPPPPEQPR